MQKRIISGFNAKLAASKFALSLTSQYVGAKISNNNFGVSSIDWADVLADQVMHPLAGAAFSAGVDANSTEIKVNSPLAVLVGTMTGWASNRVEGFFDNAVLQQQMNKSLANVLNYIHQFPQKGIATIITPITTRGVDTIYDLLFEESKQKDIKK